MASYKSIFPAGLILSQHINSMRELEEYTAAWYLDRTQLSRGDFYSHLDAFHTHYVQLGLTSRSMRLAIRGDFSSDFLAFVIILNDASMIHKQHTITNKHLTVLESGGEIDTVFIEPISFLTVCIHRDLLREKYEQKFHEIYPVLSKFELRLCDEVILNTAKNELVRILDEVLKDRSSFLVPENMNNIENIIIDQIIDLIHTSCVHHGKSKSIETAYVLFQLIQTRSDSDINIELMCKELNVSQRNAYLTFQKHYRITPKQYYLSLRLGNIRKLLINGDPNRTKIEEVALSNGFYHMSHFAKIYKSFFGELPSQTLWKNKRVEMKGEVAV